MCTEITFETHNSETIKVFGATHISEAYREAKKHMENTYYYLFPIQAIYARAHSWGGKPEERPEGFRDYFYFEMKEQF